MPTQTSLQTAIDNTGNPYPAVRVLNVQVLAAVTTGSVAANLFQATTKVVRVCGAVDAQVQITGVTGSFLVTAGFYQDFIVNPGNIMSVRADTADGNVSIAELV